MTSKSGGIIDNVKDQMVTAIKGAGDIAEASMDAIAQTAHAAISDTAKVGGDLGGTATNLVEGAIGAAKELGLSVEEAASAAADGALKAADKVGMAALMTVRTAVTGTIAGVKAVLNEPFKSDTKK
jgi:hypothetical protein